MTVKGWHIRKFWNERKEENKKQKGEDASGMSSDFIMRFEIYISLPKNKQTCSTQKSIFA